MFLKINYFQNYPTLTAGLELTLIVTKALETKKIERKFNKMTTEYYNIWHEGNALLKSVQISNKSTLN